MKEDLAFTCPGLKVRGEAVNREKLTHLLQNTVKQDTPQLAAMEQKHCTHVGLRDFHKQPLGLRLISVANKE